MYRSAACVCFLCGTPGPSVTGAPGPGRARSPPRSRSRSRFRGGAGAVLVPVPVPVLVPGAGPFPFRAGPRRRRRAGPSSHGCHLAGDCPQGPAAPPGLPALLSGQGGTGNGAGPALLLFGPGPRLSALPGLFPARVGPPDPGPPFPAQVPLPSLDLPGLSPAWSVPPIPARPPRSCHGPPLPPAASGCSPSAPALA